MGLRGWWFGSGGEWARGTAAGGGEGLDGFGIFFNGCEWVLKIGLDRRKVTWTEQQVSPEPTVSSESQGFTFEPKV